MRNASSGRSRYDKIPCYSTLRVCVVLSLRVKVFHHYLSYGKYRATLLSRTLFPTGAVRTLLVRPKYSTLAYIPFRLLFCQDPIRVSFNQVIVTTLHYRKNCFTFPPQSLHIYARLWSLVPAIDERRTLSISRPPNC